MNNILDLIANNGLLVVCGFIIAFTTCCSIGYFIFKLFEENEVLIKNKNSIIKIFNKFISVYIPAGVSIIAVYYGNPRLDSLYYENIKCSWIFISSSFNLVLILIIVGLITRIFEYWIYIKCFQKELSTDIRSVKRCGDLTVDEKQTFKLIMDEVYSINTLAYVLALIIMCIFTLIAGREFNNWKAMLNILSILLGKIIWFDGINKNDLKILVNNFRLYIKRLALSLLVVIALIGLGFKVADCKDINMIIFTNGVQYGILVYAIILFAMGVYLIIYRKLLEFIEK